MLHIPKPYNTALEYLYTFWFIFTSNTNLDVNTYHAVWKVVLKIISLLLLHTWILHCTLMINIKIQLYYLLLMLILKLFFFSTFTTQWAWTWWEIKWNLVSWEEHLLSLKNNLLCVWSMPSHDFQRHFRFPSLRLWLLVRVCHLGKWKLHLIVSPPSRSFSPKGQRH